MQEELLLCIYSLAAFYEDFSKGDTCTQAQVLFKGLNIKDKNLNPFMS